MTPNTPFSDDELGAMLGQSVQAKVDHVPTITPGFDGVERRARQITNRRRTAAGLAVGALALFGGLGAATVLGDDENGLEDDVVTEPVVDDDDLIDDDADPDVEPPVTVTDGIETLRIEIEYSDGPEGRDGTVSQIPDSAPRLHGVAADGSETLLLDLSDSGESIVEADLLADGSLLVNVDAGGDLAPVRHLPTPDAVPVTIAADGTLVGSAVVDDVPYAFVTDEPGGDGTGALRAVDLETYDWVELMSDAVTAESHISSVDVRGDLLVIDEQFGGGSAWLFRNLDGSDPGLTPVFGGEPGSTLVSFPRFDRTVDAMWWVEIDVTTFATSVVRGGIDGVETARVDLGPGSTPSVSAFEVTDGRVALVQSTEDRSAVTIHRIDPVTLDLTTETVADPIRFVEPAESTITGVPAEQAGAPDAAPEPELADWEDPADFGIIGIESDTDIGAFGPITAPLVGFDENDTVWVVTPVGDDQAARGDLWSVDTGLRGVRYVEDPTIDGDQNVLFEIGDRVIHVDEQKRARVIAENATLVGADMRLGRPTAYVAFHPSNADDPRTGDLQFVDLRSGESLLLFETIASTVSTVRNVVLGGDVTFVEVTGDDWTNMLLGVDDPDSAPTGFGEADAATLSADGSTLYWLNEIGADPLTFRPEIELTVADVATGAATTITTELPPSQVALDYDVSPLGDQLLLVRSWPGGLENGVPSTSYATPLLLDPATGAISELSLDAGFWKPVAS
ncbi:MAG: hypothetical protein AAF081_02785 [Actinomycetota bacterium]